MKKSHQLLIEYHRRLSLLAKSWEAHSGQKKILQAIDWGLHPKNKGTGVKRIFVQAGRKFGKTELCMYAAWRVATLKDNAQAYIIGPTRKQQGEIMWAPGRLQNFGPSFGQVKMDSEYRIKFPWGSFIKVDGSENYEAYRGTEYDIMILDEFKDQKMEFYEAVYPNLLSKDGILIVIGTPPDRENHYIQLRDEIMDDERWQFFHATSWDNPTLPGGHEWLTQEKAAYQRRGDVGIWQREYEAEFVPGGAGAVFPDFTRTKHVKPFDVLEAEISRDKGQLHWYTVSDPGTSSVFAVLFIAYNPYTSQVYVMDEIYETDRKLTSTTQIWNRVLEKKKELAPLVDIQDWYDVYDSAAPWFANEVAIHYGHGITPAKKQSGEKEQHVSLIKDAMSEPGRFNVSDRCVKHIWELQNYVTELDNNGNPRYIKKDDHTVDGLRYFMEICGYTLDAADVVRRTSEDGVRRYYTPEQDMEHARVQLDPFSVLDGDFDDWH